MDEVVETATQRGVALLDLGRAAEAERHLRGALAGDPGNAEVLSLLADALLRQDRYEPALETIRSALAADPEHVRSYSVLAAVLVCLERYEEALDAVRDGLALAPESPGLALQEGGVLLAQGRHEDALVPIERAGRLDPESSAVPTLRAAALCELRRYAEADAALDEALRLDPEDVEAHRIRGLIALRRGGGGSAVRAHRTALRLDPTHAGTRHALSTSLKTRNPLYGLLLRVSLWLDSLPKGVRVAVLLAPLLLTRVLRPFEDQLWSRILIVLVTAVVLLSWTLEPLMNCVLLLGRDRRLLSREAKQATYGFLAFLLAAVTCVVFAEVTGPARLVPIAFGFGLWAMVSGMTHTLEPGRRKVVAMGAVVAAAVGAAAVVAAVATVPAAAVASTIVLLGGVAALWYTALTN